MRLALLGDVSGICRSHATYWSRSLKLGISGRSRAQLSASAHTSPVPRGANIHLWVPAQK